MAGRRILRALLVVAALVIMLALAVTALSRQQPANTGPDESQTFAHAPTPPSGVNATLAAGAIPAGPRPTPQEETFKGCPPGGDGTDPQLNRLKNRIDAVANPAATSIDTLLQLPWPAGIDARHMAQWSASDRAQVDRSNGAGLDVDAYLTRVQAEGAESPNCHSTLDIDFHVWIAAQPQSDRTQAVIVEITPRMRALHPGWTLAAFQQLARAKARVRVTGWLMLDPEHPDQVGKTRGTIWELHPVTKVEVFRGGTWIDLDTSKSAA